MTLRKAAPLLFVLSLLASLNTCNQAIMNAPPGSTISLTANPEFIAAHGDVSVVSGFVVDATGNPVADGTVVQFFTNLGRIEEQGKTNDGVVRINFTSDSRSGTATVTAVSGGGATVTPTPSPSAGSEGPPVSGFVSSMSVTGASEVAAAQATATVTITIGTARVHSVIVTAGALRITTGGSVAITARVFDATGNPVVNVPVIFTITGTTNAVIARLDSGGREIFTDNNGQAIDILRTNSLLSGSVTVRATTATGQNAEVAVQVN
jgi:hypothetical protein